MTRAPKSEPVALYFHAGPGFPSCQHGSDLDIYRALRDVMYHLPPRANHASRPPKTGTMRGITDQPSHLPFVLHSCGTGTGLLAFRVEKSKAAGPI